jgi:cytosine/adenosine deaminase-related metal-dependent hydrolase
VTKPTPTDVADIFIKELLRNGTTTALVSAACTRSR